MIVLTVIVPLGTQDVVAIKPIGKGKEITVSYLPAGDFGSDVRDVRQAYLRQYYGFQCLCSTCTLKVIRQSIVLAK